MIPRFRSRSMRRSIGTLALVLVLVAAGCDSDGGSDDGTGGAAYPNIARVELTAADQAAYDELIAGLLGSGEAGSGQLSEFWSSVWPSVAPGQLYADPTSILAYEGSSQPSGCGLLSTENAYYCHDDNGIYYDDNLLRALYANLGRSAPALLLAHEWGHHVQSLIGLPAISIQSELQADCLAGMFFAGGLAVLPEGDWATAGATILILGDQNYRASEWFKPLVHGPASWRAKAFLDGALGDIAYCRDYEGWTERGTEEVGAYRWLPAPTITIERGEAGYINATLRGQSAFLAPLGVVSETTALESMPRIFNEFTAGNATPIGQALDVPTGEDLGGVLGGTAAVQAYTYTDSAGSTAHGLFFVHRSTIGEAFAVGVQAGGVAPANDMIDPAWNPLTNYLFVVAFSLCPPDGAGALCLALGEG